jgi:predicted nucleic acid-binding protein
MQIFLDASVFLTVILNDNEKESQKAKDLLAQGISDETSLVSTGLVLSEIALVLKLLYGTEKAQVVTILRQILMDMSFVKFENRGLLIKSLELFANTNMEFTDCYNLAYAKENDTDEFFSFDTRLKNEYVEFKSGQSY